MNTSRNTLYLILLIVWLSAVGCDTTELRTESLLVVEAYLDSGKPLPTIRVRQTGTLGAPYSSNAYAVSDARVQLQIGDQTVTYRSDGTRPGFYLPEVAAEQRVPAGTSFVFETTWYEQRVVASGRTPQSIRIDSLQVHVPSNPVAAVLLDSLNLDSLGTVSRLGFIYPVEVSLWWDAEGAFSDTTLWIRPQLRPQSRFSSTVIDFFLRPEQIVREHMMPADELGRRKWTGVYAIPVDEKTDPLPSHTLRVALLRSGYDYARFASSRANPERREPISNVTGGLGIVAGISVDSVVVSVR